MSTIRTSGPEWAFSEFGARLAAIDAALIGKATRGERSAFDLIYDTLFPLIWSLSARGGVGRRDAERVTERILGRVALSLGAIPAEVSFADWLRLQINEELGAFQPARSRQAPTSRRAPLQPQA